MQNIDLFWVASTIEELRIFSKTLALNLNWYGVQQRYACDSSVLNSMTCSENIEKHDGKNQDLAMNANRPLSGYTPAGFSNDPSMKTFVQVFSIFMLLYGFAFTMLYVVKHKNALIYPVEVVFQMSVLFTMMVVITVLG